MTDSGKGRCMATDSDKGHSMTDSGKGRCMATDSDKGHSMSYYFYL